MFTHNANLLVKGFALVIRRKFSHFVPISLCLAPLGRKLPVFVPGSPLLNAAKCDFLPFRSSLSVLHLGLPACRGT
jgi:hypothetical protein